MESVPTIRIDQRQVDVAQTVIQAKRRNMTITRIIPMIQSCDIGASQDFYCSLLGLVVDMQDENFRMFSSPANPSAQLILNDNGYEGLPPGFAVDVGTPERLQEIYQAVVKQGRVMVEPLSDKPWGIRRFSMLDPNGVCVTVVCHM
jgi:uncharacterized glyoxalase superfamily protein PhnB